MVKEQGRITGLDSLRDIAAITVVFSHLNFDYLYYGNWMPYKNSLLHIFYDGEAAVIFFFVLSGFVLSYKYFSADRGRFDTFSYANYIVQRVFRIYPLYWVVLILSALCAIYLPHSFNNTPQNVWTSTWWTQSFNWDGLLRQFTLLHEQGFIVTLIGPVTGNNYVPQSWSLEVEVLLSILVPVFIIIAFRGSWWLIFFTAFIITVFWVNNFIIHFVMGILLARNLPVVTNFFETKNGGFRLLALAAGIVLYSYKFSIAPYFDRFSVLQKILFSDISIQIIIGIGVMLIISVALTSVTLKKVLAIGIIKFSGKVSYGIYLCHSLMLAVFTPWLINYLNAAGFRNAVVLTALAVVFTLAGTVLMASVFYYTVELKGIAFGKWLTTMKQEKTVMVPKY